MDSLRPARARAAAAIADYRELLRLGTDLTDRLERRLARVRAEPV